MQFVARQPIMDLQRRLVGFELLFRTSLENYSPGGNPDAASKKTADAAVLLGLDILSAGHKVFLNCPEEFLVEKFPTLFPPELTVVELLETVQPRASVIRACTDLKRMGYAIALDDFVPQSGYEPLIELADLIKVDIQSTPRETFAKIAKQHLSTGHQLLAEKVETEEEFKASAELGFTMFQGYLLSRPKVLATANIGGLAINHYRILRLLSQPGLDLVEAENVIKSDPALCYRFLRFLNSPAFYFQSEIRSILHALTLLGEEEARKWLLMVCDAVADVKPSRKHLLEAALVRARFAELIAPETRLSHSELFLLGLFSSFGAILNLPLADIADQIAVSSDVRAGLLGAPGPMRSCLELVLAYEQADWHRCEQIRKQWQIPAHTLNRAYLEAAQWAKHIAEN